MSTKLLLTSAALASPFVITGVCFVLMALRVRAWPSVSGRILESKSGFSKGGHLSYNFKARYSYSVGGRAFESSRVTMADWYFTSGVIAVHRFQKRFPPGQEVPVYYDPANPKRSVLYKPGFASATFLILWGLGTFLGWLKFGPKYG